MNSYYQCRLCLEEFNRNVDIFTDEDFPQMIELLTGLKIDRNDGLPTTSCKQCYKEVKSAMLTRYQIINSHKILLKKLNSMKETVKATRNSNSFEKVRNTINTTTKIKTTLRETYFVEDVDKSSIIFSTFFNDSNELTPNSNPEYDEMSVIKDQESRNNDTDEISESYVGNEDSDDSLSSADADKLIANAEDIIKAAKSNPSKDEERAFKKLIRKLQSREGRAGKSFKQYNPYLRGRKKKEKGEVNQTQLKKKNASKQESNVYRVNVNYEFKPEHLEYLKSVRKKDRATCPVCSKEMYGANLKSHLITHTYDPTPCHLCGKTSKNAQALQDHINYYHKTTPDRFICDQCGKGFRVPCFLEKHRKKEHQGPREKPFECHVCGKKFYEKKDYLIGLEGCLRNEVNNKENSYKL